MTIPKCPADKIIVQFENKYQDEILTQSGIKFYKDTTFNPEWNVAVTGKVISLPNKVRYPIIQDVQIGDELVFSYLVVHDKVIPPDDESFLPTVEQNDFRMEYQNGLKDTITVIRLDKRQTVATYVDQFGELKDGCNGTAKQVEKWLTQYKFGENDRAVYANLLWHDEQDFWMVDYSYAIAVKRGEETIMIGGNCLLEPPEERMVYERSGPGMELDLMAKFDYGMAKLLNIGKPLIGKPKLDVKAGDKVRFNHKFVQKYELWGKKYFILPQIRLIAKENADKRNS